MKTKVLGRTGLQVAVVGLGGAYLGVHEPAVSLPRNASNLGNNATDIGVATVHAAIENGCTLVDTAPLYGDTLSETIIGRALEQRPDLAAACIVTTKVGRRTEGRDYTFDAILRSVDASRRRLRIERFEIVYIHDAMGVPMAQIMGNKGALGALRRLQAEGVVRFVGTAANDPETNAAYIETGEFDAAVVANAWSLVNQKAARRIFPAAQEHDVGLVCATPLEGGLLLQSASAAVSLEAQNVTTSRLENLRSIHVLCQRWGFPIGAVALQWCTGHELVASVIPGASTPSDARENAHANDLEIPEAFWTELAGLS